MRSRKLARWCTLLLSSGASVVLASGAAARVTTSTMPIYTTTTRMGSTTTTPSAHSTTTTPRTTSTTLGASGTCSSLTACEVALMATLPNPATATKGKDRRVAHDLARLAKRAVHELDQASAAKPARQARLFKRANRTLERIRTAADKAESKGSLTVPVGPIDSNVAILMALGHPA